MKLTLRHAAQGQRAARDHLLRTHGGLVWALCRRIASDPEDAYQDAWLHLFQQLHRFEGPVAAFPRWLSTVVNNKLRDRGRRQTRRTQLVRLDNDADTSTQVRIDAQVAARGDLERGLAALTEEQRRTVLLFHTAGLSLEEIAKADGVAVGTVKSRLHRARAALTARLEHP